MGLDPTSYEAYCLDEAVIIFGLSLEAKLEEVSEGKPSKETRRAMAARQRVLDQVLGSEESKKSGFADPAQMFK